jgi:hypothetical protein
MPWKGTVSTLVLPFALLTVGCDQVDPEPETVATIAALEQPECPATTATLDSAAAVARAAEKAFGGYGVEIQYNVMMTRPDSLGYIVRFSVIDPPGAIMLGAPAVVRVCHDGSAVIMSVERAVEGIERG